MDDDELCKFQFTNFFALSLDKYNMTMNQVKLLNATFQFSEHLVAIVKPLDKKGMTYARYAGHTDSTTCCYQFNN